MQVPKALLFMSSECNGSSAARAVGITAYGALDMGVFEALVAVSLACRGHSG